MGGGFCVIVSLGLWDVLQSMCVLCVFLGIVMFNATL